MSGRAFLNSVREGIRGIVRHPLVTIASVTTITLMLIIMSIFLMFSVNARGIMGIIYNGFNSIAVNLTQDNYGFLHLQPLPLLPQSGVPLPTALSVRASCARCCAEFRFSSVLFCLLSRSRKTVLLSEPISSFA